MAVFAVLWLGARTEFARGLAARMITERTGLPATVGTLRVGFLPSPSVEFGGLAIAQPPGYGAEPFLSVERLRLELPWSGVFGGDRFDALVVSGATARLVVGADGAPNWSKIRTTASPDGARWYLGALDVDGGVIDYRDVATGMHGQLAAITVAARGAAPATAFPLEIRLGGVFGDNTLHFAVQGQAVVDPEADRYEATALAYRGWLGGKPLPLAGAELTGTLARAAYDGARGIATLDAGRLTFGGIPAAFDGRFDLGAEEPAGELKLVTEPFAPRASAIIFGVPLPATTDPAAFESLQVAATVRLANGELVLDPVSGRFDDTNFDARSVPGRRFVRLSLDRIDLNRYLPPAAKAANRKKQTLEDIVAAFTPLDVDAELKIGEARLAGATMRDVVVSVEPDGARSP